MCCRWKNTVKTIFFHYPEALRKNWLDSSPLVKAEVIDQHKKCGSSFFHLGQYFFPYQCMRHHGFICRFLFYPGSIVPVDEFKELGVGFIFLGLKNFLHFRAVTTLEA